jgi:uncharacterized membrane protein
MARSTLHRVEQIDAERLDETESMIHLWAGIGIVGVTVGYAIAWTLLTFPSSYWLVYSGVIAFFCAASFVGGLLVGLARRRNNART